MHHNKLRAVVLSLCAVISIVLFCPGLPVAGAEPEELSASGLLTESSTLLAAERYADAVPYLTGYLDRMNSSEDARVQALMQEVRLKLGKIMIYLESPDEAVTYLKAYTEHTPLYKRREGFKLLAVTLCEIGDFESCVSAITNAFTEPPPEKKEKTETVNVESLSKEELGGLTVRQLKRYEEYAENADTNLISGISGDEPPPEPAYSQGDLVLLNMTLAEAYSGLEAWDESLKPYTYVIEHAKDEDRKGYATMQMVNALIELKRYEEAREFIAQLFHTNARYDIRVNMALMNAASALFNADEFDSALMLYRMVLPKQDLLAYQTQKMNELRSDAGLPAAVITTVTNENGRVETLFGSKYGDVSGIPNEAIAEKPIELVKLEERIGTLVSLPPYETEVMLRMGELYAAVGRPWEALTLFNAIVDQNPSGDMGQRAFPEMIRVLIDSLKDFAQAEKLGLTFLNTYKEGLAPRQVAYLLTGMYQQQEKMSKIKALLPYIKNFSPSSETVVQQYECELYYMQAIADLVMLNYPQAEAGFKEVLTVFPGSRQEDNATYWHAMSLLFLQEYEKAFKEFEKYPSQFPHGDWIDVASFRGGVCLFGMEKYDEAQTRFTHVIETWPDSAVYPDACSLRGDILGSQGLLDEAVRDYKTAIRTARKPAQAAYAVFQMTAVFESENRYQELIDTVHAYLNRYGDQADIAKAMYWIGKTQIQQGLIADAVNSYFETIVKYGGNIQQDGVDLIISELVQTASRRLDPPALARLKENTQAAVAAANNTTLALRLRVLLAKLNGTEADLGKELLREKVDLNQAPPPVLAAVCDASFALQDYSRAEELLNLFQTRFDDSEFMRAAYKLRGFDLYTSGDFDGAMKVVEAAQASYGTDYDVAWAQLMKGRILLQRGLLDQARDTFMGVLNIRDWRGESYAEATYRLGEVEEKSGDSRKAFAWYQRAYFQYKGLAAGVWAADAYLASARCLHAMGLENDRRNTYRAMLFDPYVNKLPQAETARQALGPEEVATIQLMLDSGVHTNVTVTLDGETGE